ncbi:hypothetical protein L9F63_028028, partial [Diploptera punctata]
CIIALVIEMGTISYYLLPVNGSSPNYTHLCMNNVHGQYSCPCSFLIEILNFMYSPLHITIDINSDYLTRHVACTMIFPFLL